VNEADNFLKIGTLTMEKCCYVTNNELDGVNDRKMYPVDLKTIATKNPPL
jgi:hypothetical protein